MAPSAVLTKWALFAFGGLLSLGIAAVAQQHEHPADPSHTWSYSGATGPEHWRELSPEFALCKEGKQQAPIDIIHPQSAHLPILQFESHTVPLKIIDNGHTIRQNYISGSGNTIPVGERTYELQQFHFHHPSEEATNGKHYEMVTHLVYGDKDGHLAVVGVLVKEGKPNPLISTLWSNLPSEKLKERASDAVVVNAIELLPAKHTYYTYLGSLTTPPCTEGVTFYILDTPMEFSKEQIGKFAEFYPDNARPAQPLNGRVVEYQK